MEKEQFSVNPLAKRTGSEDSADSIGQHRKVWPGTLEQVFVLSRNTDLLSRWHSRILLGIPFEVRPRTIRSQQHHLSSTQGGGPAIARVIPP